MATIHTRIGRLRRRLVGVHLAAGMVWGLAAAVVLLLLGAWLDLLWELPSEWRIATLWAAGACGVMLLAALAMAAFRAARGFALARRLDRAGQAGGRIFTGWEFEQSRYGIAGQPPGRLSAGLAVLAAAEGAAAAGRVPLGRAAPWRPLRRALAAVVVLGAIVAAVAVGLPGMAMVQWERFMHPYADVPPFSLTTFEVTPGNKPDVVYGADLEICATVNGPPVEQVELVITSAGHREPPLPMFPEANGRWRTVLSKVVEPADYFVRAYRARSTVYHLGVITVPRIESAKLRITPPAYAGRPPYEGPLPKDGVSGLRGTKVEVILTSNRPLRGGAINLWASGPASLVVPASAGSTRLKAEPRTPAPTLLPMKPAEPGSMEVSGEFAITGDGKFECRVVDEAGQESQQSFSGSVILLADERPLVRLIQPPKVSLATPSAALPVVLSAEDDCGISRLQLFRSLNDSRPLPVDLPLGPRPPRRLDAPVQLPLEQYGLAPGDVIKLFGRVEDNDPAGAKGAESAVAVVRIISEEEFQRLLQVQEGIESLQSKYDDAQRRMERISDEVEGLRKKAKKQPSAEKTADELRRELRRLRQMLAQEAEAMRQAAGRELPFDLDKSLTPELERLAKTTQGMADELEQLERERELINEKLARKLDEMGRRLASARRLYNEMAAEPIAFLEAAFPLIADQERFVMLVLWQQDLAERLSSLRGHDKEDDPALRARMRDLEEEQRQIRDALARLLDDVQEHIDKLPEKPELKELRETAQEFVGKVRKSGASEAMAAAEAALAEFAGTRGYEKAKEAADILAKFLGECQGCKGGACNGMRLVFRPKLCKSMDDTLGQLLAGLGMGNGMGTGNGMGGQGIGMGGGMGGVGLFGGLPEMMGLEKSGQGRANNVGGAAGYRAAPGGENSDERAGDNGAAGQAGGAGEGAAPARYRRQVGQYFQRIAEETGQSPR